MSVSNEQIYNVLLRMEGQLGGLEKGLEQNEDHTSHVSKKVDKVEAELVLEDKRIEGKLDGHAREIGAHGVAAEARGRNGVFMAVSILGSCFGAAVGAVTVFKFLAKAAH